MDSERSPGDLTQPAGPRDRTEAAEPCSGGKKLRFQHLLRREGQRGQRREGERDEALAEASEVVVGAIYVLLVRHLVPDR